MPRPLRIEYEDAYYHVMNRGRARQKVFHGKTYYDAFLSAIDEAHSRFGVEVLCYCLMGNHYHLLLKTPDANLGRVMRHINGVYTQRYNRLKRTDGPLFRGRYKAICVEEDSYQLQVSRYIHRNPLEAKITRDLAAFEWSSYQYYVASDKKPPDWLCQSDIYNQLGANSRKKERYKAFVEMGVDEEIKTFYGKGNIMPYLGSDEFRSWAYSRRATDEAAVTDKDRSAFKPGITKIAQTVATIFKVDVKTIYKAKRGETNIPRWISMHLSQELADAKLVEIAREFGLSKTGSIPTTIKKLKALIENDTKLSRRIENMKRSL